ncbi:acyl carrier protein [Kineococcus indalonis]|uniref:acyl carrier protein n=1 Tax=Kineococcus indalonis TaxID=2696566 RepID=UPI00196AD901|nr:acyl carrier protein [Kineococcus indalonis]NAZ85111.1 acyl carrier protein [Kineococcus indalonis]
MSGTTGDLLGEDGVDGRVLRVFREVLGDEQLQLSGSTTAQDVPGWDSLAHINIMFSLESEFGVQFTDAQLTSFADVGELRGFLARAAG